MLIKMIDGGLLKYNDYSHVHEGCPTCNYGWEYITNIDMTLTKFEVSVNTSEMYSSLLSEGDMMKILLSNIEKINSMTEREFIDYVKASLLEIVNEDDISFKIKEV